MSRILYLDCPTGIAGDMLLAALLDAGGQLEMLQSQLSQLDLGDWQLDCQPVSKNGISALHLEVSFPHQHHHRHYSDIRALIESTDWPQRAQKMALSCFKVLAEAEAQVHSCTVEGVHFHETGAVDSIIDICGVALLLDQMNIDQIYFSPLPLSSGTVECAHGILPVPAPAAALLMRGMQLLPSPLIGETITPTGAAILKGCQAIQTMPQMQLIAIGYGAGSRNFAQQPNVLRALLGEDTKTAVDDMEQDNVEVLRTNIDDASGELLGQLWEKAFALGALDMSYTPLMMKKGRPGWALELIVPAGRGAEFARLIFRESSTIGIRVTEMKRFLLPRRCETVETAFGPITVKISGDTIAPEADQVAAVAVQKGVSFKNVYQAAIASYWQKQKQTE